MKKRIDQILNEIFEYQPPHLILEPERIEMTVRKGERCRGSFVIESSAGKKAKGFLYSSNVRVGYEPEAFFSIGEKIVYEADLTGMEPGEVLEGCFTICSDCGENILPYRFEVAAREQDRLEIENMEAFVSLARKDYQKAYLVFLASAFGAMLERENTRWSVLYKGLMKQSASYSLLEEFLISTGYKEALQLSVAGTSASFTDLTQPVKESLVLAKTGWGFQRIEVSTDGAFIDIPRNLLTTDEFIGSHCTLEYLIDTERLHAGNNYGRIIIKTGFQTIKYEVTVRKHRGGQREVRLSQQKRSIAALYQYYIDFRLKRINIHNWVAKSRQEIEHYRNAGGQQTMVDLFAVQILFAAGKGEHACLLLEELEQHKERLNTPEVLGYYLYLTTFYNREKSYIDYVEESVQSLFLQNRESWQLQWVLLYLQEHLLYDGQEKLEAIYRQYLYGCRSRIMYLEAYHIIEKNPLLLRKLEEFEQQLLLFACREKLLTEYVIVQVVDLAGRQKQYQETLYEILKHCEQVRPSKETIHVICGMLIKGHKTGAEYLSWYRRGITEELRITGLYEYYIASLGEEITEALPRMVKMYFAYNNTLNYKQKAKVYANVLKNRESDVQTYENYRPLIEKFMVDQLIAGRVDQNIAYLYQIFLNRSVLNARMAGNLARILFTYEVVCEEPQIQSVVVAHRELRQEQRVSLVNGKGQVQIYTPDCQLFFEDSEGHCHSAGVVWQCRRLLDQERFLNDCRELAYDSPGMILYSCSQALAGETFGRFDIEQLCRLLELDEIEADYQEEVRARLLRFYESNPEDETLNRFLHSIDYDLFIRTDKKILVELLIGEGMCEEAFALTARYGPEKIAPAALVRMCSRVILNREYEADDILTHLSYWCFTNDKYDEIVLSYLLKHYDGPIASMKALWQAGRGFELDTYVLEEKILMVLLFSRVGAADTEAIFESHRRKLGKKKLLHAYVIYRSYDYFVNSVPVAEPVFTYLEVGHQKNKLQKDICKLALLRWYADKTDLTAQQETNALKLAEEFVCRDMRFAFYQKLPPSIVRAFLLHDKQFIEYRTAPDALVFLQLRRTDRQGQLLEERKEPMRQVYPGIFSKEAVLFRGEKLAVKIIEEYQGSHKETEMTLTYRSEQSDPAGSRFGALNQMLAEHQSEQQAEAARAKYLARLSMVKQMFTLT